MKQSIKSYIRSKVSLQPIEKVWRLAKYYLVDDDYDKAIQPTISKEIVQAYNKVRRAGAHKYICKAPFNTLNFDSYGNVQVCNYNRTFMVGNIINESLESIWNGTAIQTLRSSLKNYDFSKGCISCQNQLLEKDFEHFLASSSDSTEIHPNYPTRISFELSNICNLECIMCSGRFSNLIRKNRENLPAIKMVYDKKFFEQLKPFLQSVLFTDFFGGEPTLIKINFDIWKYLIEYNKDCHIQVTTNATYLPDNFIELLNSKQFTIAISIDAFTKTTYEKIRINAIFEDTMKNIEILGDLNKKEIIKLQLSVCPMVNNYFEIPLGIKLANEMNIRIHFTHVIDPKYLSIKYLSSKEILNIHSFLYTFPIVFQQTDAAQYNKTIYQSLLNRLKSWAIESDNRIKYINNLLPLELELIFQKIQTFFGNNKGLNKEISLELGNFLLTCIATYPIEDQPLLAIHYLYEIEGSTELNMDFPNIANAKEIINLYLKNIYEILEQSRKQILIYNNETAEL